MVDYDNRVCELAQILMHVKRKRVVLYVPMGICFVLSLHVTRLVHMYSMFPSSIALLEFGSGIPVECQSGLETGRWRTKRLAAVADSRLRAVWNETWPEVA